MFDFPKDFDDITKHPGTTIRKTFNFYPLENSSNPKIVSSTVMHIFDINGADKTSDIVPSGLTYSGNSVTAIFTAGTLGEFYKIILDTTFTDGDIWRSEGLLVIDDITF